MYAMVHLKPQKNKRVTGGALHGEGRMEAADMHQWLKAMGGKVKG
jgi:hypothetical protein